MSPIVMSLPLLYPKTLGNIFVYFLKPSLLSHFPFMYHGFRIKINHHKIQILSHTHHVVIIVTTTIIAMLTLCYSIMSHATLILYHHASMLTLYTSLIPHALWLPQA